MRNIVNVGYDSTNYYVVETAATKLLVDIGFPGTLPKLQHALKRTGIALTAIAYLLVTHYHPDHAGLAQELKQQGLELVVLEPQVPAISQHGLPGSRAGVPSQRRGPRVSMGIARSGESLLLDQRSGAILAGANSAVGAAGASLALLAGMVAR